MTSPAPTTHGVGEGPLASISSHAEASLHGLADALEPLHALGLCLRDALGAATTRQVEDAIVESGKRILRSRARNPKEKFLLPSSAREFCHHQLAQYEEERFGVLFLDLQNHLIEFEIMFVGTLTQTSVYPREVVKAALRHNAAAIICAHNHPSGNLNPARADEALTHTLRTALALVDVRLLDHIIVAPGSSLSMAEKGLV